MITPGTPNAVESILLPKGRAASFRGRGLIVNIAIGVLAVIAIAAVAGAIFIHNANYVNLLDEGEAPSLQHLLGVDTGGHDILKRLLVGGLPSLLYPLLIVVPSAIIGSLLAVASAWRGGVVDSIVATVIDIMFAFPGLLLAILAEAVFGVGERVAVLALIVSYAPFVARLVRGSALREVALGYVSAMKILGVSGFSVCLHVLRNIAGFVLAQATLAFGYALVDLAALSFLGLGVQPPSADWGVMVGDGLPGLITGQPAEALAAGTTILLVVVAVNIVGDSLGAQPQSLL